MQACLLGLLEEPNAQPQQVVEMIRTLANWECIYDPGEDKELGVCILCLVMTPAETLI